MDIKKELEIINTDKEENINDVINQAMEEAAIADKRVYILKVVNFANKVEQLASTNLFKKNEISFIKLCELGGCDFYDENNKDVKTSSEQILGVHQKLGNITPNFYFFDKSYRGNNFDDKIDLQGNIRNQILDIVLSKELKAIVDYNEMDAKLKESNLSTKKLKL